MNIPFTISGLRKAGLTQTQIGAAIGLRQSSVSDMETGKAGIINPSAKVVSGLTNLAALYGVQTSPAQQEVHRSGRQPPSPHNILDTIPEGAVVSAISTSKD
jgi:transcriptional regulator with XRE-family HTH domain